jgi:hypothetical protein
MQKSSLYIQIPYLAFFLLLSLWAIRQPHYTWDLLGYVGSSIDTTDAKQLQRAAFDSIRNAPSDEDIRVDNLYRADLATNPYHFAEQLPFYSIKPVYVVLIKALHRTGLPFQKSAVAVSAISNFVLALLLWYWLAPYLSGLPLALVCTLIMLSPNILVLARGTLPDCLATVVAALGFYLILEKRSYFWGSVPLLLDVWIRTDALILAGIVFAALLLLGKLDVPQFLLLSVSALASYFAINHFAGSYSWPILFYNSFLGGVPAPGEAVIHVSRSAYLHQVVRGAYLWLISGGFALYILLGALAIWLNRSSMYTHMVAAVLAARGLSYVFYPNGDQRYTAVLFVLVLVALVVAIRVSLQTRFAQDRRQNASAAPTAWSAVSGSTAR